VLCTVDVDDEGLRPLMEKHKVKAMPTLVLIKDGAEADRMEGVNQTKYAAWCKA